MIPTDMSYRNHYYLIPDLMKIADEKMYEDKRYKKEHMSSAAPSISYSSSRHFHSVSSEYLIEKLHTILSNHKDQRSYAFVTADIQDFRLINEYCGYETGSNILDTVLRWNSTVQMLSTHFRVQLTTTKYVFICSQRLAVKVKKLKVPRFWSAGIRLPECRLFGRCIK